MINQRLMRNMRRNRLKQQRAVFKTATEDPRFKAILRYNSPHPATSYDPLDKVRAMQNACPDDGYDGVKGTDIHEQTHNLKWLDSAAARLKAWWRG